MALWKTLEPDVDGLKGVFQKGGELLAGIIHCYKTSPKAGVLNSFELESYFYLPVLTAFHFLHCAVDVLPVPAPSRWQ